MKKNIRASLGIVLIIVLFVGVYFLYNYLSKNYGDRNETLSSEALASEKNYEKALDITVTDENGNEVKLSDYKGTPVVLNFWASWCGPCKSELPYFEKAYKEYTDVNFLMVNLTLSDSKYNVKSFIESEGYTIPILYDNNGMAASTYLVRSIPATYFIDKEGNIRASKIGAISEKELIDNLEKIK